MTLPRRADVPVPAAPPVSAAYFPDSDGRAALARRYARWLAGPGVERGLIGPREVPRLWERHLLNCAAVAELLGGTRRVVDVGSGAGLPGIPLALADPTLRVDLLEPLQRRVDFLNDVVSDLSLSDRVRVVRGRAEDPGIRTDLGGAPGIVVRAVAPLEKLLPWCLPLLAPGSRLLAMKGKRAEAELEGLARSVSIPSTSDASRSTRAASNPAFRGRAGAGVAGRISGIELVEAGQHLAIPTRVVVVHVRGGR